MSVDQINTLFEQAHIMNLVGYFKILFWIGVVVFAIGLIGTKDIVGSLVGVVCIYVICIPIFFFTMMYISSKEKPKIEKWEQTVKEEYIEKLPVQSVPITSFRKIDTESNSSSFTKREGDIQTMELEGIENGIPFKKTLNVKVERTDEKQARITYQFLNENLPSDKVAEEFGNSKFFYAGYYNVILYIPKSST